MELLESAEVIAALQPQCMPGRTFLDEFHFIVFQENGGDMPRRKKYRMPYPSWMLCAYVQADDVSIFYDAVFLVGEDTRPYGHVEKAAIETERLTSENGSSPIVELLPFAY